MNHQIETTLEFYIKNKRMIWSLVIVIGILVSIVCILLIAQEVYGAWEFCDSVGGIYKMDYTTTTHTCDGSPIYKYNPGGWGYPSPIN